MDGNDLRGHAWMPVLFLQDPQEESVTLPRAHTSAVLDELQGGSGPHQN